MEGMRGEGGRGREEGGEEKGGRGGLSGNVAEEAFCLKSAPAPQSPDRVASGRGLLSPPQEPHCVLDLRLRFSNLIRQLPPPPTAFIPQCLGGLDKH